MIHLTDRIGNTPLLRLEHISRMVGANIFLKYEACNPFGSALDRTAWGYLKQAVDCGELKPGGCVVEASSGNLAISLAHMCRHRNFPVYCHAGAGRRQYSASASSAWRRGQDHSREGRHAWGAEAG